MDGNVSRVVEKLKIFKLDMVMVGFYKIREVESLIDVLDFNIEYNLWLNGEFLLIDVLMWMIEKGIFFSVIMVDNWFNCGKKEVLLEINVILLDWEGYVLNDLFNYDNFIIIYLVSIGEGC